MPSTRPSRPSLGSGLTRPSTRPGLGNLTGKERPSTLPGGGRPSTLPGGSGSGDRPGLGNIVGKDRPSTLPATPGLGRPDFGGGDRPGLGNIGGNWPGLGGGDGDRPGLGGGNWPGLGGGGDRPGLGGGDNNIIGGGGIGSGNIGDIIGGGNIGDIIGSGNIGGGNIGNIIGGGNIGGGNTIIGGGNSIFGGGNTIIGGGDRINIGIGNNWGGGRWGSGWGGGWGNNGWGWGGGYGGWGLGSGFGHWNDYWRRRHIHHHHDHWYHGCWSGHWARGWYVPLVTGATAWAVSATLPSWGYNYTYTYSNPYYLASATPAYDYSQPIIINNYSSPATEVAVDASSDPTVTQEVTQEATQEPPETTAGYETFDKATQAFKQGNYAQALALDEQAIQNVPNDPILHEFGALCLFAQGDYARSAAVLNALLAVAPGMDWSTMSSLYPDTEVYEKQFRALESHAKSQPDDAAGHFVLAYHYLVGGHAEEARSELKKVVAIQPEDRVAQTMINALTPPEEPTEDTAEASVPEDEPAEDAEPPETTDIRGQWRAERDDNVFELKISDDGKFVWSAKPTGQDAVSIEGPFGVSNDTLILQNEEQGAMVGRVVSGGADQFQYIIAGSPPGDEGLAFKRVGEAPPPLTAEPDADAPEAEIDPAQE